MHVSIASALSDAHVPVIVSIKNVTSCQLETASLH